jgi:ribonuclease G
VICVTGAERYVGTKQLVRIDDVGRNQAIATLVAGVGGSASAQPVAAEASDGAGDELDSTPRRRGRRGGRRRSGAKAESAAAAPSTSE